MAFQEVERGYTYLVALSLLILVVCLLTGFYLNIKDLQATGVIFGLMLVTPLFLTGKIEAEREVLKGVMIGLPALFTTAIIAGLTANQWRIMGVLTITEWPVTEAAKYPLTVRIGQLSATLGVTPAFLLSLLVNIPGPTAEESFFRIYLMNTLTPTIGKYKALIAQAVSFGVVHFLSYALSPIGIITATIAGLTLGYIYMTTNSELSVCLAHLLYNWTVVLMGG